MSFASKLYLQYKPLVCKFDDKLIIGDIQIVQYLFNKYLLTNFRKHTNLNYD